MYNALLAVLRTGHHAIFTCIALTVQCCLVQVILALGDYMSVQCHSCIGGTSIGEDIRKLDYGQHVVSGTPGRVFGMSTVTLYHHDILTCRLWHTRQCSVCQLLYYITMMFSSICGYKNLSPNSTVIFPSCRPTRRDVS